MAEIPRDFHFVFGLKPQTEPFHLAHYLCLKSCIEVNRPRRVYFHHHHEPHGPWWERIKPHLRLARVEPERFVLDSPRYGEHEEGRFIRAAGLDYAHQSDFLRLRILLDHGGVYADMDTLFVQQYPAAWYEEEFVIGEEEPVVPVAGRPAVRTLCNAVLMSRPGAAYAGEWLSSMYRVFDGTWNRHSCRQAALLQEQSPGAVTVLPRRCFFKHAATRSGLRSLFLDLDGDFEGVYSMHLWSHLWWEPWRNDFVPFHKQLLTGDYVRCADTTYGVAARPFLADGPSLAGAVPASEMIR